MPHFDLQVYLDLPGACCSLHVGSDCDFKFNLGVLMVCGNKMEFLSSTGLHQIVPSFSCLILI